MKDKGRFIADGTIEVEVNGRKMTIPRYGVVKGNTVDTDPKRGFGKYSLPNLHAGLVELRSHASRKPINVSKHGKAVLFRAKR